MSALIGGKPPPIERGTMPDLEDQTALLARRKAQEAQRQRMGRQSTMLADMTRAIAPTGRRVLQ